MISESGLFDYLRNPNMYMSALRGVSESEYLYWKQYPLVCESTHCRSIYRAFILQATGSQTINLNSRSNISGNPTPTSSV